MKIVIDARLYGTKHTGNGRYTMNLIQNLIKIDKNNQYFVLLRKEDFESLKFPGNWTKVLADLKHYTFTEQFRLPFILNKIKPDLVHFPHFNVPLLYFGNFVVTIHDLIMHKSKGGEATTRPFPLYQIWRLGYHTAFAKAVYGSSRIIVPTNVVKEDVVNFYKIKPNKITVTYEGMDSSIDQIEFNAKSLGKYISYVGNAYPHKNLDRLIEALSIYNKKHKEKINLAISSARNAFSQRLEEMSKKFGVTDNVKLLGYVPDNQLTSFYKKSLAFFYPTLIEGFGLPGLEAIDAGTLVYSSNIPVLKEIYDKSVTYFDPYDVNSIVNAIEDAVKKNNEERKQKINFSKTFIKKYSWQKMAQNTLKVYEENNK